MIEISNVKEKCFAKFPFGCAVLRVHESCDSKCPFYKPAGCEDWIRREVGDEIWLIPPEEYFMKYAVKNFRNGKWKK